MRKTVFRPIAGGSELQRLGATSESGPRVFKFHTVNVYTHMYQNIWGLGGVGLEQFFKFTTCVPAAVPKLKGAHVRARSKSAADTHVVARSKSAAGLQPRPF